MKKKRIAIVGTRGIPACYGGFETFAQEISKRLQSEILDVIVYCDRTESPIFEYEGVELKYSKHTKSEHPLLFYYDCIRQASQTSDILIVTGTGGVFFYGIPKFFRKRLITNIDGIESKRVKWSAKVQLLVKMTEYIAVKISDTVVADSIAIKQYVLSEYNIPAKRISVIEYGAEQNTGAEHPAILEQYHLKPNDYYLMVARLEPENNILEIMQGLLVSKSKRILFVVGGLNDTPYVKELKYFADNSGGKIYLAGAIYDRTELDAIRFHCYAYLHGHSVGGTNPSLLEALAAGNMTICHDNVFNREVTENTMFYFKSVAELADLVNQIEDFSKVVFSEKKRYALHRIASHYNWDRIANEYRKLINAL